MGEAEDCSKVDRVMLDWAFVGRRHLVANEL
jgi:hypothetical protein